jgi:hypothetical protein
MENPKKTAVGRQNFMTGAVGIQLTGDPGAEDEAA